MVVEHVYTPILPSWRGGATGVIAGASWPGLYVLPLGQVLIPCSVSFPWLIIDGEIWAHEAFNVEKTQFGIEFLFYVLYTSKLIFYISK